MNRSTSAKLIAVVLALALAACAPAATPTKPAPTAAPKAKVALVTPSPLGDHSFIDALDAGMTKAKAELPVETTVIQTKAPAEHEAAVRGAANAGFSIIIVASMNPEMIKTVAKEFPKITFIAIDMSFQPEIPPNLSGQTIETHEGYYLAGVAAATMTKSGVLGAIVGVAGEQFASVNATPFEAGAKSVNPNIKVLNGATGNFNDPTKGSELALAQIQQGADIIVAVAGQSGLGVIEACKANKVFAIGSNYNQDDVAPGTVMFTMIRRVDNQVAFLIKSALAGTLKSGSSYLSMRDGAVDLSWDAGSTTFEKQGPADMVAKIAKAKEAVKLARQKILDCTVKVAGPFPGSCAGK